MTPVHTAKMSTLGNSDGAKNDRSTEMDHQRCIGSVADTRRRTAGYFCLENILMSDKPNYEKVPRLTAADIAFQSRHRDSVNSFWDNHFSRPGDRRASLIQGIAWGFFAGASLLALYQHFFPRGL
jgi:hypothetical protein